MIRSLSEALRRVLRGPRLETRLTADEAQAIAHRAAVAQGIDPTTLTWVRAEQREGRPVWFVSEPGVGAILIAEVDDQSGELRSLRRLPGR